MLNVTLIVKF